MQRLFSPLPALVVSGALPVALETIPPATLPLEWTHIVRGQRMSLGTMSLGRIDRTKPDAAHDVLAVSNRLKVIWPNAGSIPAEVVQLKALWHRAYEVLKGRSVGWSLSATPEMQEPVTVASRPGTNPGPATVAGERDVPAPALECRGIHDEVVYHTEVA